MNQKLMKLTRPGMRLYFFCFFLFSAAALFVHVPLGLAGLALCTLLLFAFRANARSRREAVRRYMKDAALTAGAPAAGARGIPFAMMIFRADTQEILWTNEAFRAQTSLEESAFDNHLDEALPDFPWHWLLEGKSECPDTVVLGERHFRVWGELQTADGGSLGVTWWLDVTEMDALREQSVSERPIAAILMLDNYEELRKAGTEASRSAVLARIDEKINAWVEGTHGLLCRYDRNCYLLILTQAEYAPLVQARFSILDSVREVVTEDGVAATLSIGVGRDADDFAALFQYASLSIDMALSRGGDQAVVRNRIDFEFYGGRSKASEKRTKVKSRVMANALSELIADAEQIFVMGHKHADMDAVGAAVGICCIARKRGKRARIVINLEDNTSEELIETLRAHPEYEDAFISGNDAFIMARSGALLVVVDTNRPDFVESEQLLDACNRVAVIDHHRRAASYIESAALNFHEPYASSASELVTELLSYLADSSDMLHVEAEALLSGIVLDTKNFKMRTGARTFEAAAFLRRAGADTGEVQRYFQSDLGGMLERYDIIRHAEMLRGGVAVAAVEEEIDRVTAAKATDEMLTLRGVSAAIVLFKRGPGVNLSARSAGEINVQLIMEKLGGGGNSTTAGAQVPQGSVAEVRKRLLDAIDQYWKETA